MQYGCSDVAGVAEPFAKIVLGSDRSFILQAGRKAICYGACVFSCPFCKHPLPLRELVRKREVVRQCQHCHGGYIARKTSVWLPVSFLLLFWALERQVQSLAAWLALLIGFLAAIVLIEMLVLKVRPIRDEDRHEGRLL